VDSELGTIEVEFEGKEEFTNPAGKIQGGFLAAMLDDTMGPALSATLLAGEFAPTLNLNVQFLDAAVPGKLQAKGRVVRRGSEICFLSAELSQHGKLVATATATAVIRKLSFGWMVRLFSDFKTAPPIEQFNHSGISKDDTSSGASAVR
jgi:uncharacterized protein (TIGR00369 family)